MLGVSGESLRFIIAILWARHEELLPPVFFGEISPKSKVIAVVVMHLGTGTE